MDAVERIQQETLTVLARHLMPGQTVALLDFPTHENSGDSLIFLGELAYLRQMGVHVAYISDLRRYNPDHLRKLLPKGPILINGGGNLGDRWVTFQDHREKVIRDFPDRKIIQLPQSVDFHPGPRLEGAQAVFGSHPDLTLLIRDHEGVKRTRELFPTTNVEFCPDAAFGNGWLAEKSGPVMDAVIIDRRDSEKVDDGSVLGAHPFSSSLRTDWGLRGWRKAVSYLYRVPATIANVIPAFAVSGQKIQQSAYERRARLNVDQAVALISRGHVVATDRLHATVIAALLKRPVVALDNANGKVAAIYRDYLHRFTSIEMASDVKDAHARLDALTDWS